MHAVDGEHSDTGILVQRSRLGEPAAFEALVDRSALRLLLFLRRNGGRALRADADEEDLLQIVVERAWTRLSEFEVRGAGTFHAWLVAMARTAISDRLKYLDAKGRGDARHLESGIGSSTSRGALVDGRTTATRIVARSEEVENLNRALQELPDNERQIIEWHILEAKPLRTIAADLGMSKTTSWNRLQTAIQNLHGLLAGKP